MRTANLYANTVWLVCSIQWCHNTYCICMWDIRSCQAHYQMDRRWRTLVHMLALLALSALLVLSLWGCNGKTFMSILSHFFTNDLTVGLSLVKNMVCRVQVWLNCLVCTEFLVHRFILYQLWSCAMYYDLLNTIWVITYMHNLQVCNSFCTWVVAPDYVC